LKLLFVLYVIKYKGIAAAKEMFNRRCAIQRCKAENMLSSGNWEARINDDCSISYTLKKYNRQ